MVHMQVSICLKLKVGLSHVGYIIHKLGYIHNRAGIAALFAALSNKECSISFSPQQVFSLASIDISHIPCSLIMMGQVLIIFYHRVLAVEKKKCIYETQNKIHQLSSLYSILHISLVKPGI